MWRLDTGARALELLWNTVRLSVATTCLCAIVGVGTAWCVERARLPCRRLFGLLLALPVAVPDFVEGYGWVSLFPSVHGFLGAVLVMTLALYPLVYLPVAASLRNIDPLLAEISHSLGFGPVRTFLRVTLPGIRTGLLGGCLLVTLALLAEYGAFEIVRFQTFTTAIFTEFTLGFDTPGACAESLLLVALGLLVLALERRAAGRGRVVRSGPGARRRLGARQLGWAALPVIALLVALLCLALGVPFAALLYWLLQGNSSTLPRGSILGAAAHTAEYSAAAAALATALAVPLAILSIRYRSAGGRLLERMAYLPQALPGVVIGLALVFFAINYARPLYQTSFLLIVAYSIMFLPLALVGARAAVSQAPPGVEEAARSLGTPPLLVFLKVTLPLLAPGLAAAFALVFLTASTELTATLLLHPTGVETLSTQFWAYTSEVSYGAAAPYAALIVAISAVPGALIARRLDGRPWSNRA